MTGHAHGILLLSASAGAGHVRAAQALERAFAEAGARNVLHVNALEHTTKLFRRLHEQAYLDAVSHAPAMLGWLYDHLGTYAWLFALATAVSAAAILFALPLRSPRVLGPAAVPA